jgi:hypothetical protein
MSNPHMSEQHPFIAPEPLGDFGPRLESVPPVNSGDSPAPLTHTGLLGEDRIRELQELGRYTSEFILDGNVITVLGSHILHVAVQRGGELSPQERRFLFTATTIHKDFVAKGKGEDLFKPRPGSQPAPVYAGPEVHGAVDKKTTNKSFDPFEKRRSANSARSKSNKL